MSVLNILSKFPPLGRLAYNFIYSRQAKKEAKDFSSLLKRLEEVKDIHKGEACFIIGTGPSLLTSDLERITSKGFTTFAPNRIYEICESTGWHPDYYICQDHKIIQTFGDRIKGIKAKKKFLPLQYRDDFKGDDYKFFILKEREFYPHKAQFSKDISKYIAQGYTVTYGAIQLAAYMGFTTIYLVGIDHNYNVIRDAKGRPVRNSNAEANYPKGMTNYVNHSNLPRIEESTIAYETAEKESAKLGIKIYNATRGGKLEAFERIDIDNILDYNEK